MKKLSLNRFWAIEENHNFLRFTKQNIVLTLSISIIYFVWFSQVVAYRPEHSTLYFLILILFYLNGVTRSFVKAMLPFVIFWIVYDSLRIIPNYAVNPVHIKQPYELEKYLFGVNDNGMRLTLNEYFTKYHTILLDLLSGLFYINWVPVPFLFGIYAFWKDKALIYSFTYVFFL